jgi:hypothetical protein
MSRFAHALCWVSLDEYGGIASFTRVVASHHRVLAMVHGSEMSACDLCI